MAETHSLEELGRRLGIGRSLVYDLARRDALPVPVIRLGRRLVISRSAVDRLLELEGGFRPLENPPPDLTTEPA